LLRIADVEMSRGVKEVFGFGWGFDRVKGVSHFLIFLDFDFRERVRDRLGEWRGGVRRRRKTGIKTRKWEVEGRDKMRVSEDLGGGYWWEGCVSKWRGVKWADDRKITQ
jgi:hypothetical protein